MFQKLQQKNIALVRSSIYKWSRKCGKKIGLDLPYFIKNGFWVMFRQVIGAVSGLILSIVFARLATQEVFGQYQFILSILSIVSILAIPGLNTALTRSVARGYDGDYRKVVKVSFLWSLLSVPVLLGIGGYYYIYQNQAIGTALMIAAIFFPLLYSSNTWDSFLQGKSRFDITARYSSVLVIINTIAIIIAISRSRENVVIIILTYLVSHTFFNCYYFWRSMRYIENEKVDSSTIGYGIFLTKIDILGIIANNIDKLLIGSILGVRELAIYIVVSLIAVRFKDLAKIVVKIIMPKLSSNDITLRNLIIKHHKIVILSGVGLIFITCSYYVSIQHIIPIIFTGKYIEFLKLAQVFSITILLSMPLGIIMTHALAMGMRDVIARVNVISYILKIAISIVLISKFSLIGAVIAYNLAIVIWFILYCIAVLYTERGGEVKELAVR